jgi:hypothetical protein
LYKYVPGSSSGDGYFAKLNYKGGVKTYQMDRIAEELYDELGYSAKTGLEGGGDYIPN